MKKALAGIGTLAFGLTLAAGSALAQSQTYPMGISSPAFGPGVSSATPPAAATTSPPSRATANSSLASAPSERSDVSQTYPMGISSPAFGPGVSGGAR